MKSISEILNSLFQAPAKDTLAKTSSSVSSKGSGQDSFGDVFAKLAAQNENGSSSSASTASSKGSASSNSASSVSFASFSETDVRVTETVKLDNANPKNVAALEQSVLSLAVGLSKLLSLASNLQSLTPAQAQSALVSAGGGLLSPADAANLVNQLSSAVKSADLSQGSAQLTSEQQKNLLTQLLQQLVQNQQVFLSQNSNQPNSSGSSVVSLQVNFSETQFAEAQQSGNQQQALLVDLQTLDVKAAIVQTASANSGALGAASTQDAANRLSQLLQNLQVAPSTVPTQVSVKSNAASSNPSPELLQNFKNLVQALTQAGVGQAVLSTFLTDQKNQSNTQLQQAFAQNPTLADLVKPLVSSLEASAVPPADAANSASNNAVQTQLPSANGTSDLAALDQLVARLNLLSANPPTINNLAQNAGPADTLKAAPPIPVEPTGEVKGIFNPVAVPIPAAQNTVQGPQDFNVLDGLVAQLSVLNTQTLTTISNPLGLTQPLAVTPNQTTPVVLNSAAVSAVEQLSVTAPTNGADTSAQAVQTLTLPSVAETNDLTQTPSVVSQNSLVQNNFTPPPVLSGPVTPANAAPAQAAAPAPAPAAVNPSGAVVSLNPNPAPTVNPAASVPPPVSASQAFLNQTNDLAPAKAAVNIASAPTSTAPNVPASVITGEVAKSATTLQTPAKGGETNNSFVVSNVQGVSEIQPASAEGVSGVSTVAQSASDLKSAGDQLKNAADNAAVDEFAANSAVSASNASDKSASAVSVNPAAAGNVGTAQVVNQITTQVTAHASELREVSRLNFQLFPQNLGRVNVQIALVDQSVSARITVTNPDVRENLQNHLVDLKTALNQAGLQIDQLQVQVQGGSANLLGQYFQYQQEGFGYRLPVSAPGALDEVKNPENTGVLGAMSLRMSLVNLLA